MTAARLTGAIYGARVGPAHAIGSTPIHALAAAVVRAMCFGRAVVWASC